MVSGKPSRKKKKLSEIENEENDSKGEVSGFENTRLKNDDVPNEDSGDKTEEIIENSNDSAQNNSNSISHFTQQEIQQLKETEQLYKSSLYRLAVRNHVLFTLP